MYRGAAVAYYDAVYCISHESHTVYCYRLDKDEWHIHSQCPHSDPGLVIVGDLLTAVGGMKGSRKMNKLVTWKDGEWVETFPPMRTSRYGPAVMSDGHYVVAAGGRDDEISVELFTISSNTWSSVSSFPRPLPWINGAMCGHHIYVKGGFGDTYSISLQSLLSSQGTDTSQSRWLPLPCAPVVGSTLSTIGGQAVAVGGQRGGLIGYFNDTCDIHQLHDGKWVKVKGSMHIARYWPIVAAVSGDRVLVVGGHSSPADITAVELAALC